jgi:hypothetical protein
VHRLPRRMQQRVRHVQRAQLVFECGLLTGKPRIPEA